VFSLKAQLPTAVSPSAFAYAAAKVPIAIVLLVPAANAAKAPIATLFP
jgi:hypothetical protein